MKISTVIILFACCNTFLFLIFGYFTLNNPQETLIASLRSQISSLESQEYGGAELHDIPCHQCDHKISTQLNRRFNFFVLNLDRRPDKMRCVRDQFANFGIHVRRMHGIDSLRMDIPRLTLLPPSVKRFLADHPDQIGHVGCLYGHIRFMMGAAAGKDGCGKLDKELVSDDSDLLSTKSVRLTFRNRWPKPVDVFWISALGIEIQKGNVQPNQEFVISTALMQAWRVRETESSLPLLQIRLEHHETPSSAYTMDEERRNAVAYVFGCPPEDREKISIIFEDDVVLREDFADKLLWSFDQAYAKQSDFDLFLLNWYCNSAHWKDCDKNRQTTVIASKEWNSQDRSLYDYTSKLNKYSIVQTKFFMSGGGYAVSKAGAAKLLASFPCDSNVRTCSMAVDWHMSTLIDSKLIQVLGASPPFVLMPEMGSVQSLGIMTPPKRLMQTCGDYKSDTHYEGHGKPKVIGKDPHVYEIEMELENWKRKTASVHAKFGLKSKTGKYVAFDKPYRWNQARAECKKRGMELATIRNPSENVEALELARRTCGHVTSGDHMAGWDLCGWIGLNDFEKEGTLVWSNVKESSAYRNFVKGEPNNMGDEDGMALCWQFDGKWIDYQNKGTLPCMLCEKM